MASRDIVGVDFITAIGADGYQEDIFVANIETIYLQSFAETINSAAQMGALFILLVVVLVMTPRARFKLAATILSISALVLQLIRMVLLTIFYVGAWNTFTVQILNDLAGIPRADYNISIVGTVLGIPVTGLVLLSLIFQAGSMIRLWPKLYRYVTGAVSFVLVLATMGFNFAFIVSQVKFVLTDKFRIQWVADTYYIVLTTSISWFCFLFIVRLVMHMWEKRSILPSMNGLNAMDALVITNGCLMMIPIVFASLQFGSSVDFYAFSLTHTSVVLVLPLGSLVAQRLSSPSLFSAYPAVQNSPNGDSSVSGAASLTKRPLLMRMRPSSNATSGASFRPGQAGNSVVSGVTSEASYENSETRHIDQDLANIDNMDLERGLGGVRVDCRIESSEERISSPMEMSTWGHEST